MRKRIKDVDFATVKKCMQTDFPEHTSSEERWNNEIRGQSLIGVVIPIGPMPLAFSCGGQLYMVSLKRQSITVCEHMLEDIQ